MGGLQLLCEHGADVSWRKRNGGTALHTAADADQGEAVRELLRCGADVASLLNGDTSPLYLAAQRGNDKAVQALAEGNADVDFVMPVSKGSTQLVGVGERPEDRAPFGVVDQNQFEAGNGATALHAATENGHVETVDLLLRLGARQLASMQGASPLVLAAQYNQAAICTLLLRAGADESMGDGTTATFHAAQAGYTK
eukprot:gene14311-16923_t